MVASTNWLTVKVFYNSFTAWVHKRKGSIILYPQSLSSPCVTIIRIPAVFERLEVSFSSLQMQMKIISLPVVLRSRGKRESKPVVETLTSQAPRSSLDWGAMRIFVVLIERKNNQFLKKLHNDND